VGPLENRVSLVRELLEETKEAVGERCAIAIRISTDAGHADGQPDTTEQSAVIEMLRDLPDLFDVNIQDYSYEMGTSRFVHEAALERYVQHVKQLTDKPVVGVGRFTSPDTMLRLVQSGVLDLIGCARPSIADPFLPAKIREGRITDVRECIGCNICYASNSRSVPLACTQNPTLGEEWRKTWHPETIAPRSADESILVVGAGPAGLEAARALGQRGYRVTLAEKTSTLGGRIHAEAQLPGLSEWTRVRDWRIGQIEKMDNVDVFPESEIDVDQVRELDLDRVVLATGAHWRRDGVGRWHAAPIDGWQSASIATPEDVIANAPVEGPVLLFDDDHFYMGGVLAEKLASEGHDVRLVTPASLASAWTYTTAEQARIQRRLLELSVTIDANTALVAIDGRRATLACTFTDRRWQVDAATLVMVTSRSPHDDLHASLSGHFDVTRIGDCLAPGTIAACVYAGHRYARELGAPGDTLFRREAPDC
jgi:dimethylamine/trimethylamine dehydrogenase